MCFPSSGWDWKWTSSTLYSSQTTPVRPIPVTLECSAGPSLHLRLAYAGYPSFKGSVVDGKQLQELLHGLQANNLATHSHLITGEQH